MSLQLKNIIETSNLTKNEINQLKEFNKLLEKREIKDKYLELKALMESNILKLEKLISKHKTIQFNKSYISNLKNEWESLDKLLSNTIKLANKVTESAKNVANNIVDNIKIYAKHIQHSVSFLRSFFMFFYTVIFIKLRYLTTLVVVHQ